MKIFLTNKKMILYQSYLYVLSNGEWYQFWKQNEKWRLNYKVPVKNTPYRLNLKEAIQQGKLIKVPKEMLTNCRSARGSVWEETLDKILRSL